MRQLAIFLAVILVVPQAFGGETDDFKAAYRAYQKNHPQSLAQHAARLGGQNAYAPLLSYWRAVLPLRKGDDAPLRAFVAAAESPYLRAQAQEKLLQHFAKSGRWSLFARFADGGGECAALLLQLRKNNFSPADDELRRLWRADDDMLDPLCVLVYQQARQKNMLGEEDIWRKLRRLAGARRLSATKRLLAAFPGRIRYASVRKVARRAVRYIKGKHGLDNRQNRSLVMIAAMAAARSRPSVAIARWRKFSQYFTKEENNEVWMALGEWAARWHRQDALPLFRRAAALSAYSDDALAWRTRAGIRAGQYADIKRTIAAMGEEQQSLTAWRYWDAVAKINSGDLQGEVLLRRLAENHDDYYGLLAREAAGMPLVPLSSATPASAVEATVQGDFALALAVYRAGYNGLARKIWRHAVRQTPPPAMLIAAAKTAAAAGWHLASIEAAERAPDAHHLRFPMPFHAPIEKYSGKFSLDIAFVYGLIRQESRFMPKIVSPANARGLMQVIPRTAKLVARKHRYTKYRLSRLTRVDTNVIIGTTYLSDLTARLGAEPALVAAAYNAGPGRVRRWRKSFHGNTLAYIENIPILETRLYVKYVLANRAHYDARLGRGGDSMKAVIRRPVTLL